MLPIAILFFLCVQYGVSSDILTSCDWSAVIHHPAEDSEPEDLPSTVDMDAIKVICFMM